MSAIHDYKLIEMVKENIPVRINIPIGRKPVGILHLSMD